MPSIYVSHDVANQLPATPPAEGLVYPLLRRADGVWLGARVVTGSFAGYTRSGNTLTGSTNGAFPAVDGVALNVGEVFLLNQGISAIDNGLYAVASLGSSTTPWGANRIPEFDSQADALPGTFVWVREGTSGKSKRFVLTNSTAPVINSENVTFQENSEAVFYWAFAVARPTDTSSLETRRKNRLIIAVLRALNFVLDEKNATSGRQFDFYHLLDASLIEPFASTVFIADTLPDLAGNPANLDVRPPAGGTLRLKDGQQTEKKIKGTATVGVDKFRFKSGAEGHFELRGAGADTHPLFIARLTLEDGLKQEFPSGTVPELTLEHSGVDGTPRCNNVEVIASNKIPGSTTTIAADVRHDRLTVDVATLVCTEPDTTDPKLAIEVFPAVSFHPNENLPVTMSLSNDGVCLRLPPLGSGDPTVTINRFKPCVRVTIRGPVIHADVAGTGALESLRLLEPAERKFENTVEQINDFLIYSFDLCLPTLQVAHQTMPELLRLERLTLPLPNWPNVGTIDPLTGFKPFLEQVTMGLNLPVIGTPTLRTVKLDLSQLGLPRIEDLALLNLPNVTAIGEWKKLLRFYKPDLSPFENDTLPIESISLTGFNLLVQLSADFQPLTTPNIRFALNFDRFRLHDLRFPDVGLPSLTEFDFPQFTVDLNANKLQVAFPTGLELPAMKDFWSVRLKRPNMPDLDLKFSAVLPQGVNVTFTFDPLVVNLRALNLVRGVDLLRIKWQIEFEKPDLSVNILKLKTSLPNIRLPLLDGKIDVRMLKLRVRELNGIELATYELDPTVELGNLKELALNLPTIDNKVPDLQVVLDHFDAGVMLDVSADLSLPLTKCFLSDLLGDLGSVDFRFSMPEVSLPTIDSIVAAFGSLATPIIPLELVVRVPSPTLPKPQWDELRLILAMRFDLPNFRLLNNRIYFFLPQRRSKNANLAPRQVMDFDIFTLTFPNRPEPLGFPTLDNHDGYLDLTSREFVIDLKYSDDKKPTPAPRIHVFFPGGMDSEGARLGREGVENLKKDTSAEKEKYNRLHKEYTKRFDLELDEVDPKLWPNTGPDRLMFRFNSNGLTFAANLGKTEVIVDDSGSDEPDSSNGLIKPFKFQPQDKQRELRSRIVIIDNELKEAGVYAKTEVPGVEKLMAEISVVLRQRQKGMLPDVLASMELERADEAPLAEFSIKLLEMSLDRLELGLIWRMQEKEWDYSIIADGTIAFTGAAALVPDLEGLRAPSIQVLGLDLRHMNLRQLKVPLKLVKPVRFDILDGLFGVELGDLEIGWEFENKIPKPRLLACELAKLTFKNPGALEVSVSVGGLHIEFRGPNLQAHVKLPSSLGIEVALGTTAKFAGRVGWIETEVERYLFASGKLMLEGLPEIRGLLKFGTGLKYSGRREINLVLYGEMDLDEQLFSGAVVKSLGLGVGLNNRLAAIPPTPSADAILRRIDLVKPGEVEGWQFVREGGFYMSVIGSVTLASNLGEPDVLNAYVAALVVSIDTNFDLVAAGKLWLSCSVKGQKANPNSPAFVGAMVLSPRQRKLEVVLESRKNAYVEQNNLIKKLLDKGFVRFAFRMTPQLVDYHLAEVSYRDQMFGVQMEFKGEYRFAIFKRAVLLKNELSATGSISKSLSGGAGGFDLDGQAYLRLGYGGLLSDRGSMAYAFIEAGIRFRVSAWIEIGFSISFKICGKRFSKSWTIVFRTRVPQLELTLRGHVAVADRGGLGGFDLLVGINVPICGYRLNVTVGWAVNAELYQEVRSVVAAFEAELEAAVKALDDNSGPSFAPAFAPIAPGLALTAAVANAPATPPPETWLLYTRDIENESIALLLPAPEGRWMTPTMATLGNVEVKIGIASIKDTSFTGSLRDISAKNISTTSSSGQGATFDVQIDISGEVKLRQARSGSGYSVDEVLTIVGTSLPGGATPNDDIQFKVATIGRDLEFGIPPNSGLFRSPAQVRLIGLRGEPKLDGVDQKSWPIKASDDTSITLDIQTTSIDTGPYSRLLAGVWYIEEPVPGLASQDHDTVPYVNEVERAVLRTEAWHDAKLTGSILTTTTQHNFPASGKRVLLRATGGPVVDNGRPEVTVLAKAVAGQPLQLQLVDFSISSGPADFQYTPAIEIAPPWSASNRLAALRANEWDVSKYRDYTGAAAAWAETAAKAGDDEAQPSGFSYAVVFDERYTSADPRFSPPDAPVEPGVLSTRFRPIDDVEAVGVDAILEAARRFEEASRGVARQHQHGAFDLDDREAIEQGRAQATQLLVHRLSDPRSPENDNRLEAPVVEFKEDEQHKILYGWFCKANKATLDRVRTAIQAGNNDVVFVRRAGRAAEAVTVKLPDNTAINDKNKPTPLPIRQDFVIDEASDVKERGRVIVRLPIRYSEEVWRRRPQDIGKLQVYRRIGDGPEELVFDHLRPDVNQLDKKQVYSHSRQQFVDDPHKPENTELKGTFDQGTRTLSIVNTLAILLPQRMREATKDPLEDLKCRVNETDYKIEGVVRNNLGLHLTLTGADGLANGETTFVLVAEGLIVPRPVLISDEFKVTERQFESAELRAALGSGRAALVHYSLRLLSEDEPGGANPKDLIHWPAPVPLFIPKKKASLPNLALAIPVESLVQSSPDGVTFQLVDLSEETPRLAERDGRPISAEEFEFWLDGDILRQSGFYAGEAADPNPPREGDGERVTLDAVDSTDGFESTAGKMRTLAKSAGTLSTFRLAVEEEMADFTADTASNEFTIASSRNGGVELRLYAPVRFTTTGTPPGNLIPGATYFVASVRTQSGTTKIKVAKTFANAVEGKVVDITSAGSPTHTLQVIFSLPAGAAFRAFFRPKGETSVRSLRRLPILLVRKLPRFWDSTVRYRLIDTAEIIPKAHKTSVEKGEAIPQLVDFSADDRYEAGRAAIRSVWLSLTLMEGGVELQFRDFDDSSMRSRTLVEVLEADEFANSQTDFRDDTFWTPRPPDRVERYASRLVATATAPDEAKLKAMYLWQRLDNKIDVVRRLEKAKGLLNSTKWADLANAVRTAQIALLSFEKSPLNLNRVTMRQLIELLRLTLRAVVVGNKVGTTDPTKVQDARANNQTLLEMLTRIEQSRPETVSDSNANDVAFLDRDTARKLAGIVRRRIAIADEVLALQSLETIPRTESMRNESDSDSFARQSQWKQIYDDALSLAAGKPLSMTTSLVSQFSTSNAKDDCIALITNLITSIDQLELEGLVPRAAGLNELLYQLNKVVRNDEDDTPAGLLKRPHHELTTTRKEDGEIVAREVQLRDLLPSRARQAKLGTIPDEPDERLERLGIRAGHVATLFANGNVAIWTTRGHSVHDKDNPMERVQYFATAATAPRAFELSEVAEGPRLLIAATFDGTPDVHLWDAGEARKFRTYGDARATSFAATPRGLEVALVRGATVELHTTEPNVQKHPQIPLPPVRDKMVFKDGEITTTFDGPVAYHDEIQVVVAARGNEILFWRDMGRPEHKTPFHTFELKSGTIATHIKSVTLPSGAGFVIASTDTERGLFFLNPLSRRSTVIDSTAIAVAQLAVDRRELKASAVIGNKIHTYDLLELKPWSAKPDAKYVAILHGRREGKDESYLAYSSLVTVEIASLKEDRAETSVEKRQSLPEPKILGQEAPVNSEIVAIASALQTARTATAAADPLSLFHLWERLGFALDIAAQDKTTRLLPLTELRLEIDEAINAMQSIYKAGHFVYVIEGEEPDAEFRDDRVGFSHVNVAVVPEEFLAACLEPNFDAIERWLTNRSITLAPNADEKKRELEYIVHMTRLIGVPHASRFGNVTGSSGTPAVARGGELRLQPRSDRFVRVPASAGFSHWSWTLPDRKGHRMLVAARRVSRYEPLLRWWLNLHTRFDLPEEVSLGGELTISNVTDNQLTVNQQLPLETGWQPLRLEIMTGPAAGQRREVLPLGANRNQLSIDPGDPWLVLPANTHKCRVMDAAPGWRLVVIDAIHDPAYGEGARPLMVYQYPHSRKPRFSYQIPLDGMRATYNQISRVRTGYNGIEAAFRYYLPERIDDPQAPELLDLLSAIGSSSDTPAVPPRTVTNVAGGAEPDVRLFRHERMVSLPGLPFFYKYRLDVRSAYKARQLEWDRSTAAERLPDDENTSPSAQRLPASLGLNVMELRPLLLSGQLPSGQPNDKKLVRLFAAGAGSLKAELKLRVRQSSTSAWIDRKARGWNDGVLTVDVDYTDQPAEGWEYQLLGLFEAVLYVSANRDHLTQEEVRSEPAPVVVPVSGVDVHAHNLPDYFMDYHLYRLQQAGSSPLRSLGDLFSVVGTICMPWSPNFAVPTTFPNREEAVRKPFVSVASGVKLVEVGGGGAPRELGQEASLQIVKVDINNSPYWRVRFGIANDPGQASIEEDMVFIQAVRDGKITRAVQCKSR